MSLNQEKEGLRPGSQNGLQAAADHRQLQSHLHALQHELERLHQQMAMLEELVVAQENELTSLRRQTAPLTDDRAGGQILRPPRTAGVDPILFRFTAAQPPPRQTRTEALSAPQDSTEP